MPESKKRRQPVRTPATGAQVRRKKGPSPVWLAPLMLTLFFVGIAWLVVYYLSNQDLPVKGLEGYNLLVGFGFIVAGFVVSTQWR